MRPCNREPISYFRNQIICMPLNISGNLVDVAAQEPRQFILGSFDQPFREKGVQRIQLGI